MQIEYGHNTHQTTPIIKPKNKVAFHGEGTALLGIMLSNIVLTLLTLGIYNFWGKVRVQRYLYSETEFMGERFGYHATGMERLIGFLKAALIIGVMAGILALIGAAAEPFLSADMAAWAEEQGGAAVAFATNGIILIFVLMTPLLVVARTRFRMSRTSWRNLRFRFTGKIGTLAKLYFVGTLLSIITLGLYLPVHIWKLARYYIENSYYGSEGFKFVGDLKEFYKLNIVGLILSILTLGVYTFWWNAKVQRYTWRNTLFQGKPLNSDLRGLQLFGLTIIGLPLTLCTLGLALPFVMVYSQRIFLGSISMNGAPDLTRISGEIDSSVTEVHDGIAEVADALEAVGDFLG